MIPAWWYTPAASALWQVMLHSLVVGAVFYAWARHLGLPCGRPRRWLLRGVLLVPLATALVPGRGGFEFREQTAWLDSHRLLAVPLVAGVGVYHLVLAVAAVTVLVTLTQELGPVLRRHPRPDFEAAPEALLRRVRELPGWGACRVGITPEEGIVFATAGRHSRPRLLLSRGALGSLDEEELGAVIRHESAHWQRGRWWGSHLLFLARLAQLHNPVALWAFREHAVETEIACDAEAVAGGDPRPLARVLVSIYEATEPRDVAARSTLRRRVDILLGRAPRADDSLPLATVLAASGLLLLVLPWVV